ncbi:hypothetical protein A0H81_04881 [Grifola frondosa]|uniref:Uncharacterized protein n=1 Tax=Grifola frondosa TaxID=5627 RepID=A0A1C7MKF7_GRIFR|nr:hypothetical protein A0H81_04881 [Grifola frondosa]
MGVARLDGEVTLVSMFATALSILGSMGGGEEEKGSVYDALGPVKAVVIYEKHQVECRPRER